MPIIQPGFRLINKYTLSIALIVVILIAIIVIKSTGNTSKKEDEKLIRPVRVVKVIHKIAGQSLSLTGEILAKNEIDLSFRIDGKLIERLVSVGDTVTPSQVIARLDSQDVKDNLTAARSNLNAAQAALDQATSNEARQKILLSKGVVTNAKYEDALSQLQSAQAKVEGAEANLNQAQNRVEYTNLKADTEK